MCFLFPAALQEVVIKALRMLLGSLGVMRAADYRTHDLRRGHADDLRRSGGRAAEIYRAGTWKPSSRGPFSYLHLSEIEMDAVDEAADPWSSDYESDECS